MSSPNLGHRLILKGQIRWSTPTTNARAASSPALTLPNPPLLLLADHYSSPTPPSQTTTPPLLPTRPGSSELVQRPLPGDVQVGWAAARELGAAGSCWEMLGDAGSYFVHLPLISPLVGLLANAAPRIGLPLSCSTRQQPHADSSPGPRDHDHRRPAGR